MEQVRSVVDGEIQDWLMLDLPAYAVNGDTLHVHTDDVDIKWDIFHAMVVVGCRLDGWLIEVRDDELYSVDFGSIDRFIEDDDAGF